MNNMQQELFFSNIDDYVTHLRWLFFITDGNQLNHSDIVKFVESQCEQLEKYEKSSEKGRASFVEIAVSEFAQYENYIVSQMENFCLSDYLNPKGRLIKEIRNTVFTLPGKDEKEQYILSLIVQIKEASALLFKSGEYDFSISRGENNTSVSCKFTANTDICGINLVNNDKIDSITKDAMCFLFQIVDSFSSIINAVCLENNLNASLLLQKAGVILCERDIEKISNLIGSEELTMHYISRTNQGHVSHLIQPKNESANYKEIASENPAFIAALFEEFKKELNTEYSVFVTAVENADFSNVSPHKLNILMYSIYILSKKFDSNWYDSSAKSINKTKRTCSGVTINAHKDRFIKIATEFGLQLPK